MAVQQDEGLEANEAVTYLSYDILKHFLHLPDLVEIRSVGQSDNLRRAGLVELKMKSPEFRLLEDKKVVRIILAQLEDGTAEFCGFENVPIRGGSNE